MTAREFASLLRARKIGRDKWVACCPAHPDKHPSLAISVGKKVPIIMCCMSNGCTPASIIAALGLTWPDLGYDSEPTWKQRVKTTAIRVPCKRKPLGKQEAIYRYVDEYGELVAEKLRFEGKVFLWRRPDASGGWIWRVDRETLPLFLLNEVVKASIVILTEGEKDALNLRKAVKSSVAVTTAPNGAKSWKPEYAQWFKGKMVWIIPDSDKPGAQYATLARSHIAKVARRVRVVSVAPFKDVSDYLKDHSFEDLKNLLRGSSGRD